MDSQGASKKGPQCLTGTEIQTQSEVGGPRPTRDLDSGLCPHWASPTRGGSHVQTRAEGVTLRPTQRGGHTFRPVRRGSHACAPAPGSLAASTGDPLGNHPRGLRIEVRGDWGRAGWAVTPHVGQRSPPLSAVSSLPGTEQETLLAKQSDWSEPGSSGDAGDRRVFPLCLATGAPC